MEASNMLLRRQASAAAKASLSLLLIASTLVGCSRHEHATHVTLYNFQGHSNLTFTDVTIYEKRSNFISFVSGDIATVHKGRYTIDK